MKKVSLIALAITTTAATLASAQAPVAVSNPCPCPKAFQGFFLGGNIGYGIGTGKMRWTVNDVEEFRADRAVRGFDGGLNVGYNHRICNFGIGIEGVFNWTNAKGTFRSTTFQHRAQIGNYAQLRGNLSYVICNLVAPKIILGWQNSQWKSRTSVDPLSDRSKKRLNSFLWGLGVDFLLAKHVIGGIEYTGTVGSKKTFTFVEGLNTHRVSLKPQYNKIALTLKFIY
jgi:opacity protein-like surface antigen